MSQIRVIARLAEASRGNLLRKDGDSHGGSCRLGMTPLTLV